MDYASWTRQRKQPNTAGFRKNPSPQNHHHNHHRTNSAAVWHASSHTNDESWIDALLQDLEQEEVEGLEDLRVLRDPQTHLRGLHTTTDWNVNDYIVAVPFPASIVVTETMTAADRNESDTNDNDDNESLDNELASAIQEDVEHGLAFLQTIVPDPHYASYLQCLPQIHDVSTFDATPDFWSSQQIHQIPIPKLRATALSRQERIQQSAQDHGIDPAVLQWACWIVRSRGFSTFRVMDSNKPDERILRKRKVLLPFLDLMNHDPIHFNCAMDVLETKDDDDASMYVLQAVRPIAAGEALTICYGTGYETSLDLLEKYGFWVPEGEATPAVDGEKFLYNNPANANLDWSLVGNSWKEQQAELGISDRQLKPSDQAQEFLSHLAMLYHKHLIQEKRIGFDV